VGGVGENNLAFKVTRKRFVIETFHLDVEGGVGERRTTKPTSEVVDGGEGGAPLLGVHQHRHQHQYQERGGQSEGPQMDISVEAATEETHRFVPQIVDQAHSSPLSEEKKGGLKKPKKRVGFQVSRPDVLDF
jgi:elongator complex protein 4